MLILAQATIDAIKTAIANIVPFITSDTAPPEKVHLFVNDVDPSASTVVGDFTEATFTGSAAKAFVQDGSANVYTDPLTGEVVMETPQDVGGLTFVCTAAPDPAQTVRGYYVTNAAGNVLIGAEKFAEPITINAVGQGIDIPAVVTRFSPTIAKVG